MNRSFLEDSAELKERLRGYYLKYYSDTLGIHNAQDYVNKRLHENEHALELISLQLEIFPCLVHSNAKVLIIGGGTGAELMAFHALGLDAIMIDPDKDALAIARQKAVEHALQSTCVVDGVVESLPFDNSSFDFIWSWTVLEHVGCYKKAMSEISRVMRSGAFGIINFPDYNSCYEGHYKIALPLFLPMWVNCLILMVLKKNPTFLAKHINQISHQKFVRATMDLPLTIFRCYAQRSNGLREDKNLPTSMARFLKSYLDIVNSNTYFLKKNKA